MFIVFVLGLIANAGQRNAWWNISYRLSKINKGWICVLRLTWYEYKSKGDLI